MQGLCHSRTFSSSCFFSVSRTNEPNSPLDLDYFKRTLVILSDVSMVTKLDDSRLLTKARVRPTFETDEPSGLVSQYVDGVDTCCFSKPSLCFRTHTCGLKVATRRSWLRTHCSSATCMRRSEAGIWAYCRRGRNAIGRLEAVERQSSLLCSLVCQIADRYAQTRDISSKFTWRPSLLSMEPWSRWNERILLCD